MPNQPTEKVPWPGLWTLQRCCLYQNGLISDRSGYDAMMKWRATATQEERALSVKKAEALGFFTGCAVTYPIFNAFFRWLFGGHDHNR